MIKINVDGTTHRIGETQLSMLESLISHDGWSPGCGWIWTNHSTTTRLLDSLVDRAFAVKLNATTRERERYLATELGVALVRAHHPRVIERAERYGRTVTGAPTPDVTAARERRLAIATAHHLASRALTTLGITCEPDDAALNSVADELERATRMLRVLTNP